MGLGHLPKIATDGLVFMYDTGDGGKSYKGEPTTNYGPASFGDWGTESTAERIATGNNFNGQPTYNCRTVVGQSYRGIEKTISGLRTAAGSSGTVTMSCMVRNNNSTSYNMFAYIGHDFTSTRNIAANSDWQKVQWTVNQSSMNNDYVEFRPYTNNASIYLEMTMPMVEVNKGHATQFVDGTRSATQGLLDRTRNSTIDLSDVSFDSNAQMTFDGTDDYLDCGNIGISSSKVTFAAWIKFSGSSTEHIIDASGNSCHLAILSGNKPYFYNGSTYHTDADAITNGVWYYLTGVQSDTNDIYINGVLSSSKNSDRNISVSNVNIGRWQNGGRYFNGDIASVQIYNRALTSTEVLQNFNAIKLRFGI